MIGKWFLMGSTSKYIICLITENRFKIPLAMTNLKE